MYATRPTRYSDSALLKAAAGIAGFLMLYLLIVLAGLPIRISTLLLFAVSACFMLLKWNGTFDLLHPIRVLGSLWFFCLGLASMRLLSYLSEWSQVTWTCFLCGPLLFIVGCWAAEGMSHKPPKQGDEKQVDRWLAEGSLPVQRTLRVAWICLAIGLAVLAYEFYLIGAVPILSENPDATRTLLFGTASDPQFDKLYLKLLHPLVDFIKYGVFLIVIVLCQSGVKSRKTVIFSVLLIVAGTLALGSQAGRSFIAFIFITSAVLFHYLRRRVRFVHLAAAVVSMFLFLGLVGYARSAASQSAPIFDYVRSVSDFPDGKFWDGVAFGYGTLTSSFEIFSRLTRDLQTAAHPGGGFLLYSLHRFIPRTDIGQIAGDLYSGELVTATFLGEFYGDYQFWGVVIGSLILGGGYGWAYSKLRRQNAVYWIYVRALLIQLLVFFPYVNFFSHYLNWIFDLFFMYFLIRFVSRQPRRKSQGAIGASVP